MSQKKEFGDFQTPADLAARVVRLVGGLYGIPDYVVEPTAGLGAFLKASSRFWGDSSEYTGYEINAEYVSHANKALAATRAKIHHRDFFTEDWMKNLSRRPNARVLVIGNPPWVTNSDLGQLGSSNLPEKSNFQGLRGFDAQTGKSNFDIAEWMLIRLIEALPESGALAVLCKTITARKVLRHFWKTEGGRDGARLFHIDAKAEFDVAVDACLFYLTGKLSQDRTAMVYPGLDLSQQPTRFGFVDGDLVSNIDTYMSNRHLDGGCTAYTWRSGIKHDASKVMEFTRDDGKLVNGYGETVDIEDKYVYPLLKSSDLGNGRIEIRKSVLLTQKHTGDGTSEIEYLAPKTWRYLMRHEKALDGRKSSIYRNRPRFCVFGIGLYSFAPWKVAVSGLYKKLSFVVISPHEKRPVMVDDTCYSIPCHSKKEAMLLAELLSSEPATEFYKSLIFQDSKRPVTIDVLRRLSIFDLARDLGRLNELRKIVSASDFSSEHGTQLTLLMESGKSNLTKKQRLPTART